MARKRNMRKRPVGKRQPLRTGTGSRANTGTFVPRADVVRSSLPMGPTGTVAEWGGRWFKDEKQRWQPTTTRSYWVIFKGHVLPKWGDVPLAEVTHADTLAWARDLTASGISLRTQRLIVGILRRILRFAVEHEALPSSPIERLRLPTPKPAKGQPLTIEQVEQIAKAIERPEHAPAGHGAGQPAHRCHRPDLALWVRLGAYCGLRAGEVLALRRESVDLERRVLIVDRSVSDVAGRLALGPTKTGRARAVPIPESLVADLTEHLDSRVGPAPDALVFTSEAGGLVSHANWYRFHFRPAVKRAGIREGLRYLDLRHTYASLLIAEGAHPRAIMGRMGREVRPENQMTKADVGSKRAVSVGVVADTMSSPSEKFSMNSPSSIGVKLSPPSPLVCAMVTSVDATF